MMIQAPRRGGLGALDYFGISGGQSVSYPINGQEVSLDQLNAGYQAVAQFAPVSGSANSPAGWDYATSMETNLSAQRAYIRSLYDLAVAIGGARDGSGMYYEPAYPAYDYSGTVPSWAQPFLPGLVAEPAVGETLQTPAAITAQIQAVTGSGVPASVTMPAAASVPVQTTYPAAVSNVPVETAAALPAGTPPLSTGTAATFDSLLSDVSSVMPTSLSSVPTWAWLAGAGVALFLLIKGK